MRESPSGAVRMVAGPCTEKVQSAGAMKLARATVCFGVSAVRCSGVELVWAARTARVPDVSASRHAIARTGPPGRGRGRGRVCGMGFSSERTRGFLGTYGRGGDSQITAKRPRAFDATNVTREL